jgi:hypothetical protein
MLNLVVQFVVIYSGFNMEIALNFNNSKTL